jgi:aminoglycoside 2'-N-acetyltransferase I
MSSPRVRLRRLATAELTAAETRAIRRLLDAAFTEDGEAFAEDDWAHAIGGAHAVLDVGGRILGHASVVEREIHVAGQAVRTGYVEAVATAPGHEGRGHGSAVMAEIGAVIAARYEFGALGTGRFTFYGRLGWERWRGPTFVRTASGPVRTPDDDDAIMVLRTPTTPELDLAAPISCDCRPGDVW